MTDVPFNADNIKKEKGGRYLTYTGIMTIIL